MFHNYNMTTASSSAMDDDTEEWVEEESLVLLELSGIIDVDYLAKCGDTCKVLGIETEEPILQLGSRIFTGRYKDTIGTAVIFEEQQTNEENSNIKQWKHKCHTFKKLDMTRAFIRPKQQQTGTKTSISSEDQPSSSSEPT